MTLIHSSIESGDFNSPLENLLKCQFEISVLLILVLIIISFVMMYNFLNNKSKDKAYKLKEIDSNTLNSLGPLAFSKSTANLDNSSKIMEFTPNDTFLNNKAFCYLINTKI
jgi:hypothetical protein